VIVVLADAGDAAAAAFADAAGGLVITPRDLSARGWRWTTARGLERAVAGGETIEPGAIAAILTRLPWVTDGQLAHVHSEDRRYVAAELTAFLATWLREFRRVLINPPAGTTLCGPGLSRAGWLAAAARAGVPVAPVRWGPAAAVPAAGAAVQTVGARAVRAPSVAAARLGERLASAVGGAAALRVHVTGEGAPRFVAADPWVDLEDRAVSAALLERLK
jgi:hypothetical protein